MRAGFGGGGTAVLTGGPRLEDREAAQAWARSVLAEPERAVVLDTETTGLDNSAEIVQLAAVALDGAVRLHTFVRATHPIPGAATAIHRITDADCAGAPTYQEVHPLLAEAIGGRTVITYNADFDRRMLRQSAAPFRLSPLDLTWACAMHQYARFVNEWDFRRNDYRWHRLPIAPGAAAHTALGDCFSTLLLLRRMAGDA
ncbi:MAG TPA: 3'-5' exonuclease [Chloroflexota bacterium]|nr:3'-5' exonuclease [Chloroflexota bacterium]